MAISIGEDGTIISSEGEIPQGQDPIIGEDGSIRLGDQQIGPSYPTANTMRIPPSSPLENGGIQQSAATNPPDEPAQREANGGHPGNAGNCIRPVSAIEYELQVKKAELGKSIRPAPIVVCILFAAIALAMGNFTPAIVSLIAAVPIIQDFMRRSEISNDVNRLTEELNNARRSA